MPTAADSPLLQPDTDTAPLGHVYALYYRRKRGERWREVLRDTSAERLWLRSLEVKLSGHFREQLIRTDLFDQPHETAG